MAVHNDPRRRQEHTNELVSFRKRIEGQVALAAAREVKGSRPERRILDDNRPASRPRSGRQLFAEAPEATAVIGSQIGASLVPARQRLPRLELVQCRTCPSVLWIRSFTARSTARDVLHG